MAGRRSGDQSGALRLAFVVTGVVVALAAAAGLLLARGSALDARAEAESRAREIELVGVRAELSDAVHRYIDAVVAGRGVAAGTEAAFADLATAQRTVVERLESLASGDDEAAALARSDLAAISDLGVDKPTLDLFLLEELRFEVILGDAPRSSSAAALQQSADLVSLPWLVLLDARAIEATASGVELPTILDDFVVSTADIVRDTPGWTGPGVGEPFDDGFLPVDLVEDELPALLDELNGAIGLDEVWVYDRWLIDTSGRGPAESAPVTVEELSLASLDAATAQRAAVLAAAADAAAAERAEAADALAEGWVLALVVGLAAVGVGLIATSVLGIVRNQRRLAVELHRDPLTGAHNRRFAESTVTDRCREDGHHIVAVVDLDRFKLVNDTYGHDVGDALLVAASDRLRSAVDQLTAGWAGSVGEVVRMGGDEFLVAVHSPVRIPVDEVVTHLRRVSGPVVAGSETVQLEASFGVTDHRGPVELTEMMTTADLAAYEDKRARSSEREREAGAAAAEDQLARGRALAIRAALAADEATEHGRA
ncbi:MAG: GGDEF domain-containing protein [Actinomycetota bacterium]